MMPHNLVDVYGHFDVMAVNFHHTVWHHILEDSYLHNLYCKMCCYHRLECNMLGFFVKVNSRLIF